jgi:hypothetical protein
MSRISKSAAPHPDAVEDAGPQPPAWYPLAGWAPYEGHWFWVPEEVREAYAACAAPGTAEARRFDPEQIKDWRREDALPELPPGVSLGRRETNVQAPMVPDRIRIIDGDEPRANWVQLVYADDSQGLLAWWHRLMLVEARAAARRQEETRRYTLANQYRCACCGQSKSVDDRFRVSSRAGDAFVCAACAPAVQLAAMLAAGEARLDDGASVAERAAALLAEVGAVREVVAAPGTFTFPTPSMAVRSETVTFGEPVGSGRPGERLTMPDVTLR